MVLTYVLGVLVAYGYWLRRPGWPRFVPMAILFCLGTMVDWGAYYIGGILPAFHFLNRVYLGERIRSVDWMLWLLFLLGVVMFAAFLGHLYWVDPKLVGELGDLAAERSGLHEEYGYQEEGFSNFSLLERTVTRSAILFTLPALALGITGLMLSIARLAGAPGGTQREAQYVLLYWALGFAHLLVFRHVYWVHEFLVHTLMVPVAVSAGWLFGMLPRLLPPRETLAAAAVFALLFLPWSLEQTRQKFWEGQVAEILEVAEIFQENVPEGAVIFTSATGHPFASPAVAHYAGRDVVNGIETIADLRRRSEEWKRSPLYFMAYEGRGADPEATSSLVAELGQDAPLRRTSWGALYRIPARALE
jgi:hypothetical protein